MCFQKQAQGTQDTEGISHNKDTEEGGGDSITRRRHQPTSHRYRPHLSRCEGRGLRTSRDRRGVSRSEEQSAGGGSLDNTIRLCLL